MLIGVDGRPGGRDAIALATRLAAPGSRLLAGIDAELVTRAHLPPGRGLHELAERRGADLLVVGSRGYGPAQRLFHGSISSYLVRHVACPLLVLPRCAIPQVRSGADAASSQAAKAPAASPAIHQA